MGAESSLYMTNGDLLVEGGQRCCRGGGGVAMDEYHIRSALLKDVTHADEHACGDIV